MQVNTQKKNVFVFLSCKNIQTCGPCIYCKCNMYSGLYLFFDFLNKSLVIKLRAVLGLWTLVIFFKRVLTRLRSRSLFPAQQTSESINRLDTITEGACLWITRSLPQFQYGYTEPHIEMLKGTCFFNAVQYNVMGKNTTSH